MADNFVLPPDCTLAELLTITCVIGSPPMSPEIIFPAPWASSCSATIRILLLLHQVHDIGSKCLGGVNDEGTGGILLAARFETCRCFAHFHSALHQDVDQINGLAGVPLVGGDHVRERA